MTKLVLMASMAMMIVLPLRAARYANPHKGLKRAISTTLLFNVIWAFVVLTGFMVLLQFPQLLHPESVNP